MSVTFMVCFWCYSVPPQGIRRFSFLQEGTMVPPCIKFIDVTHELYSMDESLQLISM